jgi:hypothetical protein
MLFQPMKRKRILFFIAGEAPTKEESAAAEALGTKMFRNARHVNSEHSPEPCDAVAGLVPPAYAKFPLAAALEEPVASAEPVPPATPEPEAVQMQPESDTPAEQVEEPVKKQKRKR